MGTDERRWSMEYESRNNYQIAYRKVYNTYTYENIINIVRVMVQDIVRKNYVIV